MKIVIVLPAFNCAMTLEDTILDIPINIIDDIILVDDCSYDETYKIAKSLGLKYIIKHKKNYGYGANQKTCYKYALSLGADIIIMLHPDYQYDPKLINNIVDKIMDGSDVVLCSRMMKGKEAIKNGMPKYKYYANRLLTIFQNTLFNKNLSEYHTGYRAYTKNVLMSINYDSFSDDFIFDNQFILEVFKLGYSIDEIYCPARHERHSSSINLFKSIKYGIQVVYFTIKYKMCIK